MKTTRNWLWWLLLIPVVAGIARLRFDAEVLNLLPERLPVAQGLRVYQEHFANARELIIALEAPDSDTAEAAARTLAEALRRQTNLVAYAAWQPAWMEDPQLASEFLAYIWLNQPPPVFRKKIEPLAARNLTNTLRQARERLITSLSPQDLAFGGYDPLGLMQMPSAAAATPSAMTTGDEMFAAVDGTFRLVYVEAQSDVAGYRECRSWLVEVQKIIAEARQAGQLPEAVAVSYTGRPVFVTEISQSMEQDMSGSSGGTLAVIGLLFWLTHRRWRPLWWLLVSLIIILAGTLAFAGLLLGVINVVSMGFAAILLGLAEDFGILIYQESRSHPELNAPKLRREVAPGIFWSALTTAGAFLMLNFSELPGMGQLGSLVAIGIAIAAVMMLYLYLPVVLRLRRITDIRTRPEPARERWLLFQTRGVLPPWVSWAATGCLFIVGGLLLVPGGIRFDRSAAALEPRRSQAKATLDRIQARMGGEQNPIWLLIPGRDEHEVSRRLERMNQVMRQAVAARQIAGYTLPGFLWPHPENQRSNCLVLAKELPELPALRLAAQAAGFTAEALQPTENLLASWRQACRETQVFMPQHPGSRWLLNKVTATDDRGMWALGFIFPLTNGPASRELMRDWPRLNPEPAVLLAGWNVLGAAVFDLVLKELPRVILPVLVLVLVSLWLAFRHGGAVLLSLASLAFSGWLLAAAMNWLGWNWNLMNLMALPLMLGMGVDFSIHILLAMRRYQGDRLAVRASVGRALLLAGTTTIAGFASLGFSTNAGLASLGKVCALGIGLALLVAVYLLPVWSMRWFNQAVRRHEDCS